MSNEELKECIIEMIQKINDHDTLNKIFKFIHYLFL